MQRNSYNYQGTPYERCNTPIALELRQGYADWFRTFRWSYYLTLIFSRDRKRNHADFLLESYLQEIEKFSRAPISCLISPEEKYSGLGMPAGRVHFHILVGCSSIVKQDTFVNTWRQPNYGGTWVSKRRVNNQKLQASESIDIQPYRSSIDASYYLFKTMGLSDWEWSLRRGHLVSPEPPASTMRSTKMRRYLSRQAARYPQLPLYADGPIAGTNMSLRPVPL
jgi:hypothetical protein